MRASCGARRFQAAKAAEGLPGARGWGRTSTHRRQCARGTFAPEDSAMETVAPSETMFDLIKLHGPMKFSRCSGPPGGFSGKCVQAAFPHANRTVWQPQSRPSARTVSLKESPTASTAAARDASEPTPEPQRGSPEGSRRHRVRGAWRVGPPS
jgi:hypothetical protein